MIPMLAALALLLLPQVDPAADRAALLDGVTALEQTGIPGPVVAFGPDAFAVLTAANGEAVVAAARFGEGRVVAFGHGGYLGAGPEGSGRARLLANAIAWVSPDFEPGAEVAPVIADVRAADFSVAAVVTWAGGDIPPATRVALRDFVHAGGGLVVGECPWGWQQLHPALELREDGPSNQVLAPMGLVFGPTYLGGGPYAVSGSRPEAAHAGAALRQLARAGATEGFTALERALQSVPAADALFLPSVFVYLADQSQFAPPSEARPLRGDDPVSRLQVAYWSRIWEDAPVAEITPAPGVEHFPGAVPADAARRSQQLVANRTDRGWISTGGYAPPGEPVVVRIARGSARGWRLRVGAHTDSIAHHAEWKRWPSVSRSVALEDEQTTVASPFGGLVYLEAGEGAAAPLHVEISGVVEAPFFDLQHPGAEAGWPEERQAPAPWAEIAGEHLILTVPSAAIRELDDPARLARFWDSVMEAHYQLAARPLPARPERFVADVQISAGYMHAGYPVMTWLDVTRPSAGRPLGLTVDAERLEQDGSWGHYHELGHNSQRGDWTFAGTGEVTCNLFSLHAGHRLNGIEPWANPWLEGQKASAKAYLEGGADFEDWKRNPGLALLMYAQLQRAFGWEPYSAAFAEYEALKPNQRPRGQGEELEQQRRDQWMVRMSRATGRDLGPFFERWGVPISAAARAETAELEDWQPDWRELGLKRRN